MSDRIRPRRWSPGPPIAAESARRLVDPALAIALACLTSLLGCQELFDADVWWQLRAGRWIVEERAIPRVDPFTFGSAGLPWVDIHWLFQVVLWRAYVAGGVAGTLLLASSFAASATLIGVFGRPREWPAWVVSAAWLPGLLLASCRFDPRPEIVTLACLSAFLAVLPHARRRAGWLWLLVPVQVLWVNVHGLFVLGPWLLALFLLDRAVMPAGLPPWRRLLPPVATVAAACLANPFGVRGVLLPLELFPKLTEGGGSYKSYIGEFMSLRSLVETLYAPWGRDLYLRLFVFLAVAFPLLVLVTSLWRAWTSARPGPGRVGPWALAPAVALVLALAVAAGLPGVGVPAWRIGLGKLAPWLLAGLGLAAAPVLARRSWRASAMVVAGCGAGASGIAWLVNELYGPGPLPWAIALASGLGLPTAWLAFRAGTRPFGPLLAASFAFLGLLSVRNMSLFGLVAGALLAAELGEWAAEVARDGVAARPATRGRLAPAFVVLVATGLLCASVATGRFFRLTEDSHRFGLRERPFYYAHDACRFAGGPGLPDRALAFGLNQAAVYEFHNGPSRRVFIDGRLEVVTRSTFERNVRLHAALLAGDPRWEEMVARLGNPLILVDHEDNAAAGATLLASPRWRCVYQDAVATVFLPRDRGGVAEELARAYPTVDFAARHFVGPRAAATTAGPGSSAIEARALSRLGSVLAHRSVSAWSSRIPIELVAMDRAREATDADPGDARARLSLGHSALGLAPGPTPGATPVGPAVPWDPALGLPWAQAMAAYREALRIDPADLSVRRALDASFALRGMHDARAALEGGVAPPPAASPSPEPPHWPGESGLADALVGLLGRGRPVAAVALAEEARRRGRVLPWELADRVACASMHLGEPSLARRAWLEAASPPSAAVLAARLADADLASWDLDAAGAGYRRALALDPALSDARVGLALAALERGRASESLEAARLALPSATEPRRRWLLEGIVSLAEPYAR